MAIDRLNSTFALIAALRENAIARGAAPSRPSRTAEVRSGAVDGRNPPSMAQLKRQLAEIAKGVDLGDTDAVRNTRTRFVRTILLWEFGQELRESPEWRRLTEEIDRTMDGEGEVGNEKFVSILKRIQAGASKW